MTQPIPEDDLPPTLEPLRSRLLSYRCSIAATTTDWLAALLDDTVYELDRLRAENASLRQESVQYAQEADRLRAGKAELIEMLATRTTHPEYMEVLKRYKPKNQDRD